jgi:protein ATS1
MIHTILLLELSDDGGCKREICGSGDGSKGQLGRVKPVFNIINFEHLFNKEGSVKKRDRVIVNSLTSGQRHVILDLRLISCGKSWFEQIVVGWGMSRHGQLAPAGSPTERPPPITPTPQVISVPRQLDPIIATSLGLQHSVFLHASRHVTGLGSNRKGQLQIVSDIEGAKDVKCTWNGTYCVVHVYCPFHKSPIATSTLTSPSMPRIQQTTITR